MVRSFARALSSLCLVALPSPAWDSRLPHLLPARGRGKHTWDELLRCWECTVALTLLPLVPTGLKRQRAMPSCKGLWEM